MHPALLTLVLLLSTFSLTFSLGLDGVRNADVISAQVKSYCDDTDGLCSNLVCTYDKFFVTLNVDALKAKKISIPNIHLLDRRCTGFPYDEEKVNVSWALGQYICGTELIVTSTHAKYKNQIILPEDPSGIIYRESYVINVTCSYPLDLNVSLPGILRPELSITYINIENTGEFKVKMAIYKDISYTTPYTDPVVALSTKSNLYVGVYIENPISDYSLLMVNCFSTPTNNINDAVKYDIIINSCPNLQDGTIKILENGVSSQGKFYIQMFKFIGDYTYVYLHCQVHLCSKTCAPSCSSFRAAANVPQVQGTLSIGPILRSDHETDSVGKASGFSMMTLIGLVLINWIFL